MWIDRGPSCFLSHTIYCGVSPQDGQMKSSLVNDIILMKPVEARYRSFAVIVLPSLKQLLKNYYESEFVH